MTGRTDDGIQEQEQGKAMKRRGLIAGAAALVAGMVAKQVAQESPVSADGGTWTFPYTGTTSNPGYAFSVTGSHGAIVAQSANGNAVYGTSYSNDAIVGNLTTDSAHTGYAAVWGIGTVSGSFGVIGDGFSGTGVGVQGEDDGVGGTGIRGISANGFPIIGTVVGATSTNAAIVGAGTTGPGVQGQSPSGHGLVGTTDDTAGHAGLVGNATAIGGVGLQGIAPGYGTMSVGMAAIFYGNVKTNGTTSAPVMQTVATHQGDNTDRLLYTMESPEAWFEDYGEGTLSGGRAAVTLDADFAGLVHTDHYHVFVTAHDAQHLHVPERTATGFTVVATPSGATGAGGPKRPDGTGTFSYRVVAKRKDITSERLT